jgi:hypothetical protein
MDDIDDSYARGIPTVDVDEGDAFITKGYLF